MNGVRAALITVVLAAAFAAAGCGSSTQKAQQADCSAADLSTSVSEQSLPAAVATTRQRIVDAAVACDYAELEQIGTGHAGFSFSFGGEKSAAAFWKAEEARGSKPLATLVKILNVPVTRNETCAYAWPSAYTEHPKAADWDALVRAGVITRARATKAQQSDNVYYGHRTAINRSGDWQFFIAGD